MKKLAVIFALMVSACGGMTTPLDRQSVHIFLFTDKSGCQYLYHYNGGITPRLDPDGKQICFSAWEPENAG